MREGGNKRRDSIEKILNTEASAIKGNTAISRYWTTFFLYGKDIGGHKASTLHLHISFGN